jgi:hypothetical protein
MFCPSLGLCFSVAGTKIHSFLLALAFPAALPSGQAEKNSGTSQVLIQPHGISIVYHINFETKATDFICNSLQSPKF